LGDNLFNRFSKGLGALDELELKSGNSACDAQTAERLARQVVNGEATTRLVIGPLCYSAFHSAQPIFEQAGIAQLPLIVGRDWESLMQAEAEIIARFTTEKMQSRDTVIAYVADAYGNNMAEKLRTRLNGEANLFPLADLEQTTREEATELARLAPSVLIVAAEHTKAKALIEYLVSYGSNAVLVMTGATQPALILHGIGAKRMDTARFPAAVASAQEAGEPLGFGGLVTHGIAQVRWLLEQDEITPETLHQLPPSLDLRMVRVERNGSLAFDLGLSVPGS